MKKNATKFIIGVISLCIVAGIIFWMQPKPVNKNQNILIAAKKASRELNGESEEADEAAKEKEEHEKEGMSQAQRKVRRQYFFRLLRDPVTNSIPRDIRTREIRYSKQLPARNHTIHVLSATRSTTVKTPPGFTWKLAGPPAVGGRTRALGIDQRNSNIIIAGAVSGGIWKSIDGGNTWQMKTANIGNYSVTSLDQDPTHPDTWYYSAGELIGNSASSTFNGHRAAPYFGTGIFKSTDNGNTWHRISSTLDTDTQFDSQFDYVERIRVSPATGTVFIASDGFGIFRSADGKSFNDLTLGGFGQHEYADVAVASDGTVAAVLSSVDAGSSGGNPGIFVSHDDGKTWQEITPNSFPTDYARSVLAFAPSNPNILYDFTLKTGADTTDSQGVSFYKLNLDKNPENASDRAKNLPDFGGYVSSISPQGGYNMCLAVKPDDPNFVIVGTVDLFRSTDGFATAPSGNSTAEKDKYWIGGYAKFATDDNAAQYPNHHPDQHILIFDPGNPDILYSGNDGGVQVTHDVTAGSVSWKSLDKGYITTQFYDASISPAAGSNQFMGGTQDNGTPFFVFKGNLGSEGSAVDVSSGDGAYSFFTENYIYVSLARSGNNPLIRYNSNFSGTYNYVQPKNATSPLFVNPYAVDPNHEGTIYYTAGSKLYRNTQVDKISNQDFDGTTQGWSVMRNAGIPGYIISAISVSTVPADILYYAGSSTTNKPVIKRLVNARTSTDTPKDISIPDAPNGAFLHDLAINPVNGNELLAIMSNYNIVGIYHTMDGGESWEPVEGNLTGDNSPTSPNPGPSIRSATIVPGKTGTIYLVGTSTGVYSARNLDGQNTQWVHESPAANNSGKLAIGYSVVEDITSRLSDGDVAVGTHGRGMFVGRFQGKTLSKNIPVITIDTTQGRAGDKIIITASNFQFNESSSVTFVGFSSVPAKIVNVTPSKITVIVPRATLSPTASDRNVTVKVEREKGVNPSGVPFKILPPQKNAMEQNFPNPFGTSTKIPISLSQSSNVTIAIFDITGRRISQPVKNKKYKAGTYNIPVDFGGHASGIYIYRIIVKPTGPGGEKFIKSKKFTYIR